MLGKQRKENHVMKTCKTTGKSFELEEDNP